MKRIILLGIMALMITACVSSCKSSNHGSVKGQQWVMTESETDEIFALAHENDSLKIALIRKVIFKSAPYTFDDSIWGERSWYEYKNVRINKEMHPRKWLMVSRDSLEHNTNTIAAYVMETGKLELYHKEDGGDKTVFVWRLPRAMPDSNITPTIYIEHWVYGKDKESGKGSYYFESIQSDDAFEKLKMQLIGANYWLAKTLKENT